MLSDIVLNTEGGCPVLTYEVPIGSLCADVTIYESSEASWRGLKNWSLSNLQKNPALTKALPHIFSLLNIRDVFVPRVLSNGTITSGSHLTDCFSLGTARVYQNQKVAADGLILAPGQTLMMSTTGCPLIIAGAGAHFIVAHAGRHSLIDPGVPNGKPTREHTSVVDAIVSSFWDQGIPPSKIVMTLLFPTPRIQFERDGKNRTYSAKDMALIAYAHTHWKDSIVEKDGNVFLDMEMVFLEQAIQAGVLCVSSMLQMPHLARTEDKKNKCERRHLVVVKRKE
ncbi:MAG TPA: hypothetical protein VMV38_01530 [Candidatus Paceibacterota bacterium]|nr:hypothetical protein [Candidatus Paceibacterota bacterium]